MVPFLNILVDEDLLYLETSRGISSRFRFLPGIYPTGMVEKAFNILKVK